MKNILDTADYKISTHNSTTYLEKKTKTLIKVSSSLSDEIKLRVIPREKLSRTPKICSLLNIHRPECLLTPVVSTFNSPKYKLGTEHASQLRYTPIYQLLKCWKFSIALTVF